MNKKGITSLAIVLLVLLTLALTSFAMFTFVTQENDFKKNIGILSYEDVYAKEAEINFYLKNGGKFDEIPLKFSVESGEVGVVGEEVVIKRTYFNAEKQREEIMRVEYKFKPVAG